MKNPALKTALFLFLSTLFLASCASESLDFSDCDPSSDRQDYGLTWVPIPGGSFMMGCVPQDSDCWDEEKPRHKVTLSAFEMTATSITRGQYTAVTRQDVDGDHPDYGDNYPMDGLRDWMAEGFCYSINARLPTDAEWEYAARAGSETIYLCGDNHACLDAYHSSTYGEWWPVAQKAPNAFGVYDMTYIVGAEYVADDAYYLYTSQEEVNPLHEGGAYHWLRSGGRLSFRAYDGGASSGEGNDKIFRCVRKAACKNTK